MKTEHAAPEYFQQRGIRKAVEHAGENQVLDVGDSLAFFFASRIAHMLIDDQQLLQRMKGKQ